MKNKPPPLTLIGVPVRERNKIRVSIRSSYESNVWDFIDENPDLSPRKLIINFDKLRLSDNSKITEYKNRIYLRWVKEYTYTLLFNPVSSNPKLTTVIRNITRGLLYLLRFMHRIESKRPSDLGIDELEEFGDWLSKTPNRSGEAITNRTLQARTCGLSWLYEQREKMENGLNTWPFLEQSTSTEWCAAKAKTVLSRNYSGTPEIPDRVAVEIIRCAIADLELTENIKNAQKAYKNYIPIYKSRRIKKDDGSYRYEIECTNPFQWEMFGLKDRFDKKSLLTRVVAASYIIIAMFTGMRVHEVLNIQHGRNNNWRTETILAGGNLKKVHFVLSKTTKLQAEPTSYRWQTIPIVEKAIRAVEIVLSDRHANGCNFLFSSHNNHQLVTSEKTINHMLNDFCISHKILHEGNPYRISSHQFRKKFSRIMIRSGLGMIELQDQLKHFDIEMTKLYGDVNLYAELQKEKFILSSEIYLEIIRNNDPIIGGGAAEIYEYRKEFFGMTQNERDEFIESLSKKALLEQVDDGLCMFRSSKALCGGDSKNCRPADCNNSIINASEKRRTFQWRKVENIRLMNFFEKDPLKMEFLRSRNNELDKLISQLYSVHQE